MATPMTSPPPAKVPAESFCASMMAAMALSGWTGMGNP